MKLGQGQLAFRPKARRCLPQLGLEQPLQLKPLAETFLGAHAAKQVQFCLLDLLPSLACSAQVTHG